MNNFQKLCAWFLIPRGFYCYTRASGKRIYCPFYSVDKTLPSQENGYCSYLGKGDQDINAEYPEFLEVTHYVQGMPKKEMVPKGDLMPMSLLFDACKECHIKC